MGAGRALRLGPIAAGLCLLGPADMTASTTASPTQIHLASTTSSPTTPGPADWPVGVSDACSGTEVVSELCPGLPSCQPCVPQDCELGDWGDWSSGDCTGLCERQRAMRRHNNECGRPCAAALIETKQSPECHTCRSYSRVDCKWSDWSEWGGCTCTCGGGQTTRGRHIATSPKHGGKLCDPEDREEIGPCNTASCDKHCVDGEWGIWQAWGPCSHSCGGGLQLRHRRIRHPANDCGVPVEGKSDEMRPCNDVSCEKDKDCVFSAWDDWSSCSCTCNGVTRRSRRITDYGRGDGLWCVGATKIVSPCNPTNASDPMPKDCDDVRDLAEDCQFKDWQEWTSCSKTCGGGVQSRERLIQKHAKGGGIPCDGGLEETNGCNYDACADSNKTSDCEWYDWSDWGSCSKCDGEMRRYRNMKRMPLFGGRPCEVSNSEEYKGCDRKCHVALFCLWEDWGQWGACSSSCDIGTRERTRHLKVSSTEPAQVLYEDLQRDLTRVQAYDARELATAFLAGFLSLVFGFSFLRLGRGSRRAAPDRAGATYEPPSARCDTTLAAEDPGTPVLGDDAAS